MAKLITSKQINGFVEHHTIWHLSSLQMRYIQNK